MARDPRSHRILGQDEVFLGTAGVDHEHRDLVALIHGLVEQFEGQDDPDRVAEEPGEIYTKIRAHRALDERVMHDTDCEQLDDHDSDHERRLDDIRDMMDAFDSGAFASHRADVAKRLQEWFGEHFRTKDARLHEKLGH